MNPRCPGHLPPDVITPFDLFFCSTVFFFLLVGGRCLGSSGERSADMAREKPAYRDNLEFLMERTEGKMFLTIREV